MVKTYQRKKPQCVEALQFKYSKEGIEEMKAFCTTLTDWGKNRHLTAIGWCEFGDYIAYDGEYVVKENDTYIPMSREDFEDTYELDL